MEANLVLQELQKEQDWNFLRERWEMGPAINPHHHGIQASQIPVKYKGCELRRVVFTHILSKEIIRLLGTVHPLQHIAVFAVAARTFYSRCLGMRGVHFDSYRRVLNIKIQRLRHRGVLYHRQCRFLDLPGKIKTPFVRLLAIAVACRVAVKYRQRKRPRQAALSAHLIALGSNCHRQHQHRGKQ